MRLSEWYCIPASGKQILSLKRIAIPQSAASVLVARCYAAETRRSHVRPTTGLCGAGVGPTKVLSKKVHCGSLSSIHIHYNQALVGGLSDTFDPATRIHNLQPYGGSTTWTATLHPFVTVASLEPNLQKPRTVP